MRKCIFILYVLFLFVASVYSALAAPVPVEPIIPVKDTVTMVDLGAKTCIPCKMMAPILKELQDEYDGRDAIIFIDVWEDKSQGKRFGIQSIPTQIFYDKYGSEVYRHQGFYSKKDIKKWLDTLIER